MCCISLNIHVLQSLLTYKIFIIKIPKKFLYIFLVLNAVFINAYHIILVQDDISAKTIPIWLYHTVGTTGLVGMLFMQKRGSQRPIRRYIVTVGKCALTSDTLPQLRHWYYRLNLYHEDFIICLQKVLTLIWIA